MKRLCAADGLAILGQEAKCVLSAPRDAEEHSTQTGNKGEECTLEPDEKIAREIQAAGIVAKDAQTDSIAASAAKEIAHLIALSEACMGCVHGENETNTQRSVKEEEVRGCCQNGQAIGQGGEDQKACQSGGVESFRVADGGGADRDMAIQDRGLAGGEGGDRGLGGDGAAALACEDRMRQYRTVLARMQAWVEVLSDRQTADKLVGDRACDALQEVCARTRTHTNTHTLRSHPRGLAWTSIHDPRMLYSFVCTGYREDAGSAVRASLVDASVCQKQGQCVVGNGGSLPFKPGGSTTGRGGRESTWYCGGLCSSSKSMHAHMLRNFR